MRKRKGSEGGGGDDWLNTYADMVTLLLCFFVLLYSASAEDSVKWEVIVRSLNPNAGEVSQIVYNTPETLGDYDISSEKPADQPVEFDDLYYSLSKYVEDNKLEDSVEVTKGDNFTFIMFRNQVFFDGNSYVLKNEGKKVLDVVAESLGSVSDQIGEINILGHTSQAEPNKVNEIDSDRYLSSNRATEVLIYLQRKNIVDPSKLISSGFGQFRPVSPFDTSANRSKNRRVEIIVSKIGSETLDLDQYYDAVYK